MKKSVFFAGLLASLLLVGCGKSETPSTSEPSSTKPSTEEPSSSQQPSSSVESSQDSSTVEQETVGTPSIVTEAEGTVVASYDFTEFSVPKYNNTIYLTPKDTAADIKEHFVNSVENPTHTLASVMTTTKSPTKSVLTDGPHVGGLKFNKANSGFTMKFADEKSFDFVEITLVGWAKWEADKTTLKSVEEIATTLNGVEFKNTPTTVDPVKVILSHENAKEFEILSTGSSRPVLQTIKFYNK